MNSSYVIGLNATFHDAAVCVLGLDTSEPILVYSEDRHSGIPHHFGFPFKALSLALSEIGRENVVGVACSRAPDCFRYPHAAYFREVVSPRQDALLRTTLDPVFAELEALYPSIEKSLKKVGQCINEQFGHSADLGIKKRVAYLFRQFLNEQATKRIIAGFLPDVPLMFCKHHDTHAATFFASPYPTATVITWDGRGEFDSTVLYKGQDRLANRVAEVLHPQSIGNFYEVFAEFLGWSRVTGPGKLMGLSAYGDGRFDDIFNDCIRVDPEDFSFSLNDDLLTVSQEERLRPTQRLLREIGGPRQPSDNILEARFTGIAHGVQSVTNRVCVELVTRGMQKCDSRNVVLSGGLSLNCVTNDVLRRELNIDPFILPGSGDDGTAVGAAVLVKNRFLQERNQSIAQCLRWRDTYGTKPSKECVRSYLEAQAIEFETYTAETVADLLNRDCVIGIMEGRYEFGPRALGNRSILADPRREDTWQFINSKIKYREDFRPFAPVVLEEDAAELFGYEDTPLAGPYMLLASRFISPLPIQLGAVTHKDGTARVQVVPNGSSSEIAKILTSFKKIAGFGVLLNTSLNMSGESIISDHEDLLDFMAMTDLHAVVIDQFLVRRERNLDFVTERRNLYPTKQLYLEKRASRYKTWLESSCLKPSHYDFDQTYRAIFGAVKTGG